jgi:probable rRNA maturation factor
MTGISARVPTVPGLDVVIEAPVWSEQTAAEATVRRTVTAACSHLEAAGEICIVLTDDVAVQELNRTWRHIDKPTNVLSFPAKTPGNNSACPMLGDIVIAYETARREALAEGKPFLHHLAHLTVHGFLHLLGHHHENDAEAEEMEHLEREILASLGVKDPYLANVVRA